MSLYKNERMLSAVAHAAAEFVNRESNSTSLITVTDVRYRKNGKTINVFVSVMPAERARAALEFLERQHRDFMAFIKKTIRTRELPLIVFLPDPAMGIDASGPV